MALYLEKDLKLTCRLWKGCCLWVVKWWEEGCLTFPGCCITRWVWPKVNGGPWKRVPVLVFHLCLPICLFTWVHKHTQNRVMVKLLPSMSVPHVFKQYHSRTDTLLYTYADLCDVSWMPTFPIRLDTRKAEPCLRWLIFIASSLQLACCLGSGRHLTNEWMNVFLSSLCSQGLYASFILYAWGYWLIMA